VPFWVWVSLHVAVVPGRFQLKGCKGADDLTADDRHLFVADSTAQALSVYALDGHFTFVHCLPGESPYGVAVCQGFVLVAMYFKSVIGMMDVRGPAADWKFAKPFGGPGKRTGQFESLRDVSAAEGIVCTLENSGRVQLFDAVLPSADELAADSTVGLHLSLRTSFQTDAAYSCALYAPPRAVLSGSAASSSLRVLTVSKSDYGLSCYKQSDGFRAAPHPAARRKPKPKPNAAAGNAAAAAAATAAAGADAWSLLPPMARSGMIECVGERLFAPAVETTVGVYDVLTARAIDVPALHPGGRATAVTVVGGDDWVLYVCDTGAFVEVRSLSEQPIGWAD
jgi:hypothetical protein